MISTEFRTIGSPIPHPESVAVLEALQKIEPRSMGGFPPVVWDRAEGFGVYDAHGNKWIDFTSSIILANAGHSHPRIDQAIRSQLDKKLLHGYCNPTEIRLEANKAILSVLPNYLDKVLLLSTGSEATECAIKLMRMHGRSIHPDKVHILSFVGSFHGRTMGAQIASGFPDQRDWMGLEPGGFQHIAIPERTRFTTGRTHTDPCGKDYLERQLAGLRSRGVSDDMIAGVMIESFQGPTVTFMPEDFTEALVDWARSHDVLLGFDEVQSGFGRTGRWFAFEHYGVEPDLVWMGKGMTSSLPMSAVAGRGHILDIADPGQMSSTHTGNPLCCAATMANIDIIRDEGLVEHAARTEPVVRQALEQLRARFPEVIDAVTGKGLAWAIFMSDAQAQSGMSQRIAERCRELGLLIIPTGRTLKMAPPLCISEAALREGIGVIETALEELAAQS